MAYDNGGFKWLRIKNWEKYQPDARLRNKTAKLPWVKEWTDKLDNYDYLKLTFFQRSVLSQCVLIAGTRPSRSIPNDPTWIARTLHASLKETPRIPNTIQILIQQGYLIPTNTEKFFEDEGEFAVGEGEGLRKAAILRDRDACKQIEKESGDNNNNETDSVVVVVPILPPQSQGTSDTEEQIKSEDKTPYTEEVIAAQLIRCAANEWVQKNLNDLRRWKTLPAKRQVPLIAHLMTIEPPKRVAKAGSHAERNPELHTGLDANGESWTKGAIKI